METGLIIGLIGKRANTSSPFETLEYIFKHNVMQFVPEFFITIREYELGLEFAEIGLAITEQSRDKLEERIYRRWLQNMMLLKFEMLDRLNDVKGYLILYDELLTSKDTKWVSTYPTTNVPVDWTRYISYYDEDGEAHLHFLTHIDWRQKIMMRKWDKFVSGRPIGNQLRHQKDMLTDEQILQRADAFFERLNIFTRMGTL